jgi:hypothetical protein
MKEIKSKMESCRSKLSAIILRLMILDFDRKPRRSI